MNNENLQKLVDKASEMAMGNVWSEKAYKVNMAILKIDRNNCSAYTRLAKYYKLNDNIAEAKNMYLKALDIDPTNRGAINNLNEFERDENESDTVNKIKTTGELLKEGNKCLLKGKYRMAEKLFAKAFSNEPSLAYAINLANVYSKIGEDDKIEKLYKQLVEATTVEADVEAINNEFKIFRVGEKAMTV